MANVKATDLIDFTRASKGHALAKVSYGEELVQNGGFDTDGDWTKSDFTISDGQASTASGTAGYIDQSISFVSGKVYELSVDVVSISGGSASIQARGVSTIASTIGADAGGTTHKFIYADTSNNTTLRVYAGSGTNLTIDNISVKEVLFNQPDGTLQLFEHPNNTPRIEYDADGNLLGLLIEEARTNVIAYSDFSAGWSVLRASLEDNAATSPDKQSNAVKLKVTTDSGYHAAYDSITGGTYMVSVFAKAGEYDGIQITGTNTTNDHACFNLTDGTAYHQGSNVSNASIQEVGDGWYRCSAKVPLTNGALYVAVTDGSTTAWLPSFAGANNTDGIYIYGIQAELSADFPTSYIKTQGSTVSRAADVASIDVDQFGYNQSEGTVFADYKRFGSGNAWIAFLREVSNTYIALGHGNSGAAVRFQVTESGTNQASLDSATVVADTAYKQIGAYKANDFATTENGNAVHTDTSGTVPDGVTKLVIGEQYGAYLNGHIKSITYTPKRLSNAKLQELTS